MENVILQEIKKIISNEIQSLSTEMNKRFGDVDKRFESMNKRFETIESDLNVVKRSTLNMEVDHGKKLQILLDVYPGVCNDNIQIKEKLEKYDEILENHSMVIEVLKGKILNQT